MAMHDSPRTRRLHNDLAALDRVRSESSVFEFQTSGNPPHHYQIAFKGKGLWRDRGKVKLIQTHRVEIKLGSSYPRTIPEIRWLTPIYHPNISEIGMVCLGGYGTHWAPSVQLDELCTMLWDMARYHNYDIRSPYNRDAALWVANQTTILFPTDPRSIRDLRAAKGWLDPDGRPDHSKPLDDARPKSAWRFLSAASDGPTPVSRVRQFIERYGRPPDDAPASPPEPPSRTAAVADGDDDGMVILETTTTTSPAVESRAVEPSRGEEDILFID
ncbi:MAG: ubiquitin-conjugating enzyme E2 [Paludisphaera borealis]|uniref:ubiquitin-conjugating enzyme E2 n=1 Tax=Paludisphaera borealis TaxID=1387353 RepID=UPI00284F0A9E|nr:ubiquitin-conjugating enzyme E2 [Paludisphaera borealis]MDR3620044.1 ubiquitin-conjugating enzyme E2 [Paludisphaera borealis]